MSKRILAKGRLSKGATEIETGITGDMQSSIAEVLYSLGLVNGFAAVQPAIGIVVKKKKDETEIVLKIVVRDSQ